MSVAATTVKIPCPKCGMLYKAAGMRVHIMNAHEGRTWSRRKGAPLKALAELGAPKHGDRIAEITQRLSGEPNGNGHAELQQKRRYTRRSSNNRVFWTDDEKQKVYDAALIYWRRHPEDGISAMTFEKAQKDVLPPDRQRPSVTLQSVETECKVLVMAAKQISQAETAFVAPVEKLVEKVVEKWATPEEVLASISLPKLIGIVESRRAQEQSEHWHRMEQATAGHVLPAKDKLAKREREEVMADLGIRENKDVRQFYPKVCLVGFSKHGGDMLKEKLGRHPIHVFHEINSNVPPTESALPLQGANYFVIDDSQTPDEWKKLVQRLVQYNKIKPEQYVKGYNLERVRANLAEIGAAWLQKHPDMAKLHGELWHGR